LSQSHEEGNSILTASYSSDGTKFATAGRDRFVRVYDENTRKPILKMGSSVLEAAAGHANRIFASCFDPSDGNTLLTGGWDNTVHIWDLRSGRSERKIFGPHLAGDSLDVKGGRVLTGSWRPHDPLQVWDLGSGKQLCSGQYNPGTASHKHDVLDTYTAATAPGLIYGASFNPDASFVVAGGSGNNCVKVFNSKDPHRLPLVGAILGLPGAVFAVAAHDQLIAVGGSFDQVFVYEVVPSASSVPSVVHEGFSPATSPTVRSPQHAAAEGFSEGKQAPLAAAQAASASGAGGSVADRVMATLHTVHLDDEADGDESDGATPTSPQDSAAPSEGKEQGGYGTRSGVVGGSALAAVRARRSSAAEEEGGKQ
jgi:hypothetical protein